MSETNKTEAAGKVLGDFQNIGDAARQTGRQAREAGAHALNQAQDAAHEARARAASIAGTLGEQASSAAEAQKSNLAGTLEDVAKAVHRSGEQLEGHQDWMAHLVERGADELSALATTLRSNDLQSLLGELGSLARRQPALFVGASMAAGFALTRVGRVAASGTTQTASTPQSQTPTVMPSTPTTSSPAAMPGTGLAGSSETPHERG